MTLKELLSGIADAIRQKEGSTGEIPAPTFRERILAIMTGHDVSGVTATEGDVLDGVVFVDSAGEEKTGAIPKKETTAYVPTTTSQRIEAGQYLAGDQIIVGDENLLPENIVSGKSIFNVEGTAKTGGGEITSYIWRNVVGNGAQSMILSADADLMTQLYNNGSFYVTISDQKGKISYVPNSLLLGRYNSTMLESIRGTGVYCTDKIGGIAWGGSVVKQVTFEQALGFISIQLTAPYFFDDGEYAITISKL